MAKSSGGGGRSNARNSGGGGTGGRSVSGGRLTEGSVIGNVESTRGAVRAYRESPTDFDSAARAAVHYARRDGTEYAVIPNNNRGWRVWQIDRPSEISRYIPGAQRVRLGIARPDGTVRAADWTRQ